MIGVFNSSAIKNLVNYKWNHYAKYFHFVGFAQHCIYMTSIFAFIISTYMDGDRYGTFDGYGYQLAMGLSIVYPYIYDTVQLIK